MGYRRLTLIALLAFAAAVIGVFAGRALMPQRSHTGTELHKLLHDQLEMSVEQSARIDAIERSFAVRRQALEYELRADNAKLAAAIENEHGFGTEVAAAVDESHMAMGQLQKETLEHIFSMRALLKPDQMIKFDAAVVKALTADQK